MEVGAVAHFPIRVKAKPCANKLKRLPISYIDYVLSNYAKFIAYRPREDSIRLQQDTQTTVYPKIPKSTPWEATKSSKKASKHQREVTIR